MLDDVHIAFQSNQVHDLLLLLLCLYGLPLVQWRRTMSCDSKTSAATLYLYVWLKSYVSLTLSETLWICAFHGQHVRRSHLIAIHGCCISRFTMAFKTNSQQSPFGIGAGSIYGSVPQISNPRARAAMQHAGNQLQ